MYDSTIQKFSKVAKIIHNSISGVYLDLFVPNLAVQSLEFYQRPSANLTTLHIFHYDCMALTSLWFQACAVVQKSKWNGEKVHIDCEILIYDFNIYLIFKKMGRQLLEKGSNWKEYGTELFVVIKATLTIPTVSSLLRYCLKHVR